MIKSYSYYIITLLGLILYGCRGLYLEPLAKTFVNEIWEERPEGISCEPSLSNTTIENQELTFNINHQICVEVNMDPDEFEIMRNESRFGPSIQENDGATATAACLEYALKCGTPFPSEYIWYDAEVNVDGYALENVAVRKKGFLGSVFSSAPGMILNLDQNKLNQSIENTKRITLNNNSEDPSRVIQVLNYKIFELAGYPAPRCNFANVSVNDEPLGVYAHLEAVNERFLDKTFGNHTGDLYEGQIVDLVADWIPRWQAKTDYTEEIANPIRDVSYVLSDVEDDEFIDEISKHINLERFITFWALEIILEHNDGYSSNRNNFFIYFNPSNDNKISFIPWGLNYFRKDEERGLEVYLNGELPRRLSRIEETSTMLEEEINRLMDEVWDEVSLVEHINDYAILIQNSQNDPDYEIKLNEVEDWINNRRESLEDQLANGIPQGEEKGGRCLF